MATSEKKATMEGNSSSSYYVYKLHQGTAMEHGPAIPKGESWGTLWKSKSVKVSGTATAGRKDHHYIHDHLGIKKEEEDWCSFVEGRKSMSSLENNIIISGKLAAGTNKVPAERNAAMNVVVGRGGVVEGRKSVSHVEIKSAALSGHEAKLVRDDLQQMGRKSSVGHGREINPSLAHEVELNRVKVLVTDMPWFMQIHAFRVARHAHGNMEKFSARLMACSLKKEFDRVYGPAWHCIVGSSFGSFVTHSASCFLYFSMERLFILLFKTKVVKSTQ